MPTIREASLSVLTVAIVFAATAVTLSKFQNSAIAQGQGNLAIGNQTITPQQRAATCNPNNPKLNFVNTTESKICGIPKTITNTTSANTTAANTTIGTQAPPSATSIAPSAVR
jgi:hypothetical protein